MSPAWKFAFFVVIILPGVCSTRARALFICPKAGTAAIVSKMTRTMRVLPKAFGLLEFATLFMIVLHKGEN
ncbi:MAG: hypothetical protein CVV53_05760 [Spirochaetae bacterium HGW-Spirochaetae-9]|nr:MAG: hypothetical protein CVV53_05760 [Spirochaetae bacterium HGW-Spirochaetae-9]